jgi:hypothetical protein
MNKALGFLKKEKLANTRIEIHHSKVKISQQERVRNHKNI